MDDFEEFFQYFKKIINKKKFLTDTFAKMSKNIFRRYSFISEHSKHFFFILKQKIAYFSGGGSTPTWMCPLRIQVFEINIDELYNMIGHRS